MPRHCSPNGQAERYTDSEQDCGWHNRSFLMAAYLTNDRLQCAPWRESLLRSWLHQCPQRHQGSDRNVLVMEQLFFCERQGFHDGPCLVLGLSVDQEDDTFPIGTRIPLLDLPVEVELQSCPNLCRYDSHDLLRGHARLGSLNDQHCGGFG